VSVIKANCDIHVEIIRPANMTNTKWDTTRAERNFVTSVNTMGHCCTFHVVTSLDIETDSEDKPLQLSLGVNESQGHVGPQVGFNLTAVLHFS